MSRRRYVLAGLLLGVGLGGFVDGIVMHQLLRWHHLLSSTDVSGSHVAWDGAFHSVTWVATLAGVLLLGRTWERLPVRALVGLMVAGWGAFNVVDSVLSHWVLGLHHIREDVAEPFWWDLGFFVLALVLVATGVALWRSASPVQSGRHGEDPRARDARPGGPVARGAGVPGREGGR